jgi:hypothetical protein
MAIGNIKMTMIVSIYLTNNGIDFFVSDIDNVQEITQQMIAVGNGWA